MPIPGIVASGIEGRLSNFVSIATAVVDASGAASITFNNIPTYYSHLQLRGWNVNGNAANGTYVQIRVGNGTVDSGTNYAHHTLTGSGAAAAFNTATAQTYMYGGPTASSTSNLQPNPIIIDMMEYASTTKTKTMKVFSGNDSNATGAGSADIHGGLWNSTSAINTITLYAFSQGSASTFPQYTQFALYGIK